MSALQLDPRHPFALWLRRRGAAVGYLVFASGALLGIWLSLSPQSDGSNPFLVLLLVWVIAGFSHFFVRGLWPACAISAFGSVLGYIVLVLVLIPHEANNEMFGAGMIEVGLFAFVLSMVIGIPVVIYRRTRSAHTSGDKLATQLGEKGVSACPQCGAPFRLSDYVQDGPIYCADCQNELPRPPVSGN
jgi:hypothetical protein